MKDAFEGVGAIGLPGDVSVCFSVHEMGGRRSGSTGSTLVEAAVNPTKVRTGVDRVGAGVSECLGLGVSAGVSECLGLGVSRRDREEDDRKSLSPEAAATFRTALGKLGWVAQSRPDLCWLRSMLARGQSQPLAVHETAMRASIRYIRSVADRKLKFRSYEYSGPPRITTYVDASWAAEKSTNRKSTSGAAIFVSDCCVKAFSRLQQSVACSSAEAELYALFEGAKETIGIQHAVAHVYGCQAEELPIPGLLTDSMAARNVTEMSGLLRRLRHIDIRICFCKMQCTRE